MKKEDLDKRICDVEIETDNTQTYREFIVEAEEEIGTGSVDLDNIIKSVADSLNGIAYKDDSQIVEVVSKKYYSDKPRVEVILEDIN